MADGRAQSSPAAMVGRVPRGSPTVRAGQGLRAVTTATRWDGFQGCRDAFGCVGPTGALRGKSWPTGGAGAGSPAAGRARGADSRRPQVFMNLHKHEPLSQLPDAFKFQAPRKPGHVGRATRGWLAIEGRVGPTQQERGCLRPLVNSGLCMHILSGSCMFPWNMREADEPVARLPEACWQASRLVCS